MIGQPIQVDIQYIQVRLEEEFDTLLTEGSK